jgi:hypothetical protein
MKSKFLRSHQPENKITFEVESNDQKKKFKRKFKKKKEVKKIINKQFSSRNKLQDEIDYKMNEFKNSLN